MIAGSGGKSLVNFVRYCQKWVDHLTFLPTVNSYCCATSVPAFSVVIILYFVHCNSCRVLSYCFNFWSPNEIWWCGASFHILICHLYMFFAKMSSCLFPSFNHVVLLLLSFEFLKFILDNNSSLDISLASIFSQSIAERHVLFFWSLLVFY